MTPFRPSRVCPFIAGMTLFCIACASAVAAQPAPVPGRFGVSATVGVFSPLDNAMSDVYGNRLTPLTAQLDVRLVPDVFFFAGLKWMSADGHAVVVGTPVVDETSAASLGVTSVRIGAEVAKAIAPRWTLAGGAGAVIASYSETWLAAGQAFSYHASGFLVLAEGRYALSSRWGVVGRIEYSTVHADMADGANTVNLGGVDVSAGVRFAF